MKQHQFKLQNSQSCSKFSALSGFLTLPDVCPSIHIPNVMTLTFSVGFVTNITVLFKYITKKKKWTYYLNIMWCIAWIKAVHNFS